MHNELKLLITFVNPGMLLVVLLPAIAAPRVPALQAQQTRALGDLPVKTNK